jgi:hypothetical protein
MTLRIGILSATKVKREEQTSNICAVNLSLDWHWRHTEFQLQETSLTISDPALLSLSLLSTLSESLNKTQNA